MTRIGHWYWSAITAVALVAAVICFSASTGAQTPAAESYGPRLLDWRVSLITQPSFVVAGQPTRLLFNWSVGASSLPTVPLRVQVIMDGAPVYIGWLSPEPDFQELVITFPQAGEYQILAMSGQEQASVVANFPLTVGAAATDQGVGDNAGLWNLRNWMQQHRLWLLVGYVVLVIGSFTMVLGGIMWRASSHSPKP